MSKGLPQSVQRRLNPEERFGLRVTLLVVAMVLVAFALLLTGTIVGILSGVSPLRRALRQLAIGAGAAGITYVLGVLVGASLG